ncbi:Uncharacterised protein [BD1-7 clade bacterium]|uniref:Uncharacterized protein n=1 Tax=BD1-7 clade bacterium TaxID=2029982 RepID=A0A5S9PP44_9GAMM|nr:Uncharacterised protein [BD1-7 clade bacterium]
MMFKRGQFRGTFRRSEGFSHLKPGQYVCWIGIALALMAMASCQQDSQRYDYPINISIDNDQATLDYDQRPPDLKIMLNNVHDVTSDFAIGENQATGDLSAYKDLMVEGKNTLEARHAFGKSSQSFIQDTTAPIVIITNVLCNGERCHDEAGERKTIKGEIRNLSEMDYLRVKTNEFRANTRAPFQDYDDEGFPVSAIGELVDDQLAEIDENNHFQVDINHGGIFTFEAKDTFDNVSEFQILANGNALNPIFKLRMGTSAMESLRPVLNDVLSGLHLNGNDPDSPFYSDILKNFSIRFIGDGEESASTNVTCEPKKAGGLIIPINWKENCQFDGVEGSTTLLYLGDLVLDQSRFHELRINDSETETLQMDLAIRESGEDPLRDYGMQVSLRALVSECKHELYSEWHDGLNYWFTKGIKCSEKDNDGLLSLMYANDPAPDGKRYATLRMKETLMKGPVGVAITDGALETNVNKVKFSFSGLSSVRNPLGIPIGWLTPIIELILPPLVQATLNNALHGFSLPLVFTSIDNGTKFSLQPEAFQVFTQSQPDNPIQEPAMHMNYLGIMATDIQSLIDAGFTPEDIPPVLGSSYTPQNLPAPAPTQDGDNLEITLNSNFINQALLTLYNTGLMHISVVDGQLFFGPKATDNMNGTLRIRLVPNGPANLTVTTSEDDNSQPGISWRKAQLYLDRRSGETWAPMLGLDVDLAASVDMFAEDNQIFLKLNAPELDVISVRLGDGDTESPLMRQLLDIVVRMILPIFTDQTIPLPLPDLSGPDGEIMTIDMVDFTTEEGGHMNIKLNIAEQQQPSTF